MATYGNLRLRYSTTSLLALLVLRLRYSTTSLLALPVLRLRYSTTSLLAVLVLVHARMEHAGSVYLLYCILLLVYLLYSYSYTRECSTHVLPVYLLY